MAPNLGLTGLFKEVGQILGKGSRRSETMEAASGLLNIAKYAPKQAANDVESRWAAKQSGALAGYTPKDYEVRIAEKMSAGFGGTREEIRAARKTRAAEAANIKDLRTKRAALAGEIGPAPEGNRVHTMGPKATSGGFKAAMSKFDAYSVNKDISTKAAGNAATSNAWGMFGSFGSGLEKHVLDSSPKGFASHLKTNMMIGAGAGLVGGMAAGAGSLVDPSSFQSNGVVKPMLQGAFKGALLSAAHASGNAMTKVQSAGKHAWIQKSGRMMETAAQSKVTRGALMMVAAADGGSTSFTRASNPIK